MPHGDLTAAGGMDSSLECDVPSSVKERFQTRGTAPVLANPETQPRSQRTRELPRSDGFRGEV
jgi:hypothetical protein